MTGDQTRVTVYPGVIAYPDVVFFVPLKSCLVKHLRPMFDKRMLNEGIAVDLCLVENARGTHNGSLIDLQHFVTIGGQAAGGNHLAVGEETRFVGKAAITTHLALHNRDVVTDLRVMADLRGVNAGPSADGGLMADHAEPG